MNIICKPLVILSVLFSITAVVSEVSAQRKLPMRGIHRSKMPPHLRAFMDKLERRARANKRAAAARTSGAALPAAHGNVCATYRALGHQALIRQLHGPRLQAAKKMLLRALVNNRHYTGQVCAAEALGAMRAMEAVPTLRYLVAHAKGPHLRIAAQRSLRLIYGQRMPLNPPKIPHRRGLLLYR